MGRVIKTVFLAFVGFLMANHAFAAGPVETSVFSVQGVAVDITDTNAAAAKEKALLDVQMKAIVMLAEKLGSPEFAAEIGKLDSKAVVPFLKSLSIEEEKISPGRYEGKFTVRFLPEKIKPLLERNGIAFPIRKARPCWCCLCGLPQQEHPPCSGRIIRGAKRG